MFPGGSGDAYLIKTFELRLERCGCIRQKQKHVQKLEGKTETLRKFQVVFMHGAQDGKQGSRREDRK